MPVKRRQKPLKQKPAFKQLKKLIDLPGEKDLLWYHGVGKETEKLCPAEAREYGKSQIDTLAEAVGQPKPFSQKLWNARRFFEAYDRNEVKAMCQPKKGSKFRLAWGHLVRLLSLSNADRAKFQRKCVNGEWSSRELGSRLKEHRGKKGKGGRRYARPATLEHGLKQLIAESNDWQQRFHQIWFHAEEPAIDFESKAASTGEVADLCGEAVEILESIQQGIERQLPELRCHVRAKKKTPGRRKGK